MKKLGLCVCYNSYNFGSQLQVLATMKALDRENVNYSIIKYNKKLSPIFILHSIPRLLNFSFVKNKIDSFMKNKKMKKYPEFYEKNKERIAVFKSFEKENFSNYYHVVNGYKELKLSANEYDGFLVGSDQLWLPSNYGSRYYNLLFAPNNSIKISYATSFGVNVLPWYQKKKTARYLKRINYLSVREESGKKIIKNVSNLNAEVVLDPTLLFNKKEWLDIIPSENKINEKYVFCYFLGDNKLHKESAILFAKKHNLKLVTIPSLDNFCQEDLNFGDIQCFDLSSFDFVNMIRGAEYVLTDSFHCSVFSIINHKKFIVYNRFPEGANSRNSRIDNLCNICDLQSRRFNSKKVLDEYIDLEIDYEKVDNLLETVRGKSVEFLKQSVLEFKRDE